MNHRVFLRKHSGVWAVPLAIVAVSAGYSHAEPTPQVSNPAFGDVWFCGSDYRIEWNPDLITEGADIALYKGREHVLDIADDCPTEGFYTWNVPCHLEPGGDYRVRINEKSEGAGTWSSAYFRIVGEIKHAASAPVEQRASWTIHTVDVGNVGYYTSIDLDTEGNPHISYYDSNADNLKHAWWDGGGWRTETVDSHNNVGTWTSIGVDDRDNVHISYCYETDRDLKYAKWDGASWNTETADASGNRGEWSSLTLDENGNPHVSYIYGGAGDLMYAFKAGPIWGTVCVDDYRDVGKWTSIALDGNGYPHISYHDYYWLNYTMKYAYWNGAEWSRQTIASYPSGYYTSIAVDSSDHPHITHQGPSHCNYMHWDGSWHSVNLEPHTGDLYVGGTSIDLDKADRPHVCYYRASSDSARCLKYAYWDGLEWSVETVDRGDTNSVGGYCSLVLDDEGLVHISYIDWTNGTLKYAVRQPTGIDEWPFRQVTRPTLDVSPNPSRLFPTSISFEIPENSHLTLSVHNLLGQEIRVLEDGRRRAGRHTIHWDGTDGSGRHVSAGTYFLHCSIRPLGTADIFRWAGNSSGEAERVAVRKLCVVR